jgi:NADH:ubiquinone oxidoreductase subunit F (NADH-binding)
MRFDQVRAEAESAYCDSHVVERDVPRDAARDVFGCERRVALRNCGRIDPRDINDYVATCQGYSGLRRALELGREGAIQELRESGLRGRGGAGYLTALKWQICHDSDGEVKYAICNAVDADPRARTARLLLGSDPHSVLEGLLVGAYAVGAAHCFVCINADYGEEIALVREALEQMKRRGLLGDNILELGFSCEIEVKEIPGSLVSGEETALLRALEDRQPLPYLRFAYPAVKGLHDVPTLINSAETLANVSAILQQHPAAAQAGGTGKSEGTKIVTLSGGPGHDRTVEVPFGTTIRTVIEQVGGAGPGDSSATVVQFGGPTGALFTGDSLDMPITCEDLEAAGSTIGSAGIRVFGGEACAVGIARDIMSYLREQSCGKCVVCREGTYQLVEILNDIAECRAETADMELLLELSEAIKAGSICGLGKAACDPVLSSIKLFSDDYDSHIHHKRCAAKA